MYTRNMYRYCIRNNNIVTTVNFLVGILKLNQDHQVRDCSPNNLKLHDY